MDREQQPSRRRRTWKQGEQLAAKHLQDHGYTIVETNWRCRTGELDIIAEASNLLVIVEVRASSAHRWFGVPEESVDARKQLQVKRTAQVYLHQNRRHEANVRFDVIGVRMSGDGDLIDLKHIENAF